MHREWLDEEDIGDVIGVLEDSPLQYLKKVRVPELAEKKQLTR